MSDKETPVKYLTTGELMEALRVSRVTLYNWRRQGLPFVKVGRGIRYEFGAVGEWLEKQNE